MEVEFQMLNTRFKIIDIKCFSEINQTDAMKLFLLAHQLCTAFGMRLIDNGLGLGVFGAKEKMTDYAFLAIDQKAALPTLAAAGFPALAAALPCPERRCNTHSLSTCASENM